MEAAPVLSQSATNMNKEKQQWQFSVVWGKQLFVQQWGGQLQVSVPLLAVTQSTAGHVHSVRKKVVTTIIIPTGMFRTDTALVHKIPDVGVLSWSYAPQVFPK